MPLSMNREVFITCAVTGSGGTQDMSPHVPRSPAQIATAAIDAAKAGAAIVHCHVRDPATGKPSRDPALYREVTERIRDADTDVMLNLTARHLSLLAGLGSAAVLAGAFGFQYIGGLAPCTLCLWQRWPHAAAVLIGLEMVVIKGLSNSEAAIRILQPS